MAQVRIITLISLPVSILSLIFTAGYLPNVYAFISVSKLPVLRMLILNAIGGITFGPIFFYFGLIYSIVFHFTVDLIVNYPYRSMRATSKTQIH